MEVTREVPPTAENSSEDYVYNSDTNDIASAEEPRLLVPDGNIPSLLEEVSGRQVDRRDDGTLNENEDGTQDVNDEVDDGLTRPNVSLHIDNESSTNDKRYVQGQVALSKRTELELRDRIYQLQKKDSIQLERRTSLNMELNRYKSLVKEQALEVNTVRSDCQKLETMIAKQTEELKLQRQSKEDLYKDMTKKMDQILHISNANKHVISELDRAKQQIKDQDWELHNKDHRIQGLERQINDFAKTVRESKDEESTVTLSGHFCKGVETDSPGPNDGVKRLSKSTSSDFDMCDDEPGNERLSEIMSFRLRDNNPNITDLSDENRPTKLAEMMNELYDNEWTNVFSYLEDNWIDEQDFPEEKCIEFLLNIIMETYTYCNHRMTIELTDTIHKLFWPTPETDYDTEIIKRLKDDRKRKAEKYIPIVYQVCVGVMKECPLSDVAHFSIVPESPEMTGYLAMCVKLCWLMMVQDPPMYLHAVGWRSKQLTQIPVENEAREESKSDLNDGSVMSKETEGLETQGRIHRSNPSDLHDGADRVGQLDNMYHDNISRKDELLANDSTVEVSETASMNENQIDNDEAEFVDANSGEDDGTDAKEDTSGDEKLNDRDNQVYDIGERGDEGKEAEDSEEKHKETKDESERAGSKGKGAETKVELEHAESRENHATEPVQKPIFVRDHYKEYTHRGPYIEYVVWPTTYLHKDGPVVSKGVAQGCK